MALCLSAALSDSPQSVGQDCDDLISNILRYDVIICHYGGIQLVACASAYLHTHTYMYIHVHAVCTYMYMYIQYVHVSSVGATHSWDPVAEEDHQLVEGLLPDGRELQQATEPDRHKATHVREPSMTTWRHSHIDTG